jgi:GTPase SAR1 family protein
VDEYDPTVRARYPLGFRFIARLVYFRFLPVSLLLSSSCLPPPHPAPFLTKFPPNQSNPQIEDAYRKQRYISETPVLFDILDTVGQEDYGYMMIDSWMRVGDAFVLVYSVTSRDSFEQIRTFAEQIWRVKDVEPDQMLEQCGAFIVVVGNKCDREDDRQVSSQEGVEVAQSIHASAFF